MPVDEPSHLVSEVARNEIWREHIRKENQSVSSPSQSSFRLNVKSLNILATKPHAADPTAKPDTSGVRSKLKLDKHSENGLFGVMPPVTAPKSGVPTTASQEYGWLLNRRTHKSIASFRERWHKGHSKCDVTSYADSFAVMTRKSPFSAKSQRGISDA